MSDITRWAIGILALAAVVALNAWYHRRKSKMTPKERAEDAADDDNQRMLW